MTDKGINIDWHYIDRQMPELIIEMMTDHRISECGSIREFFVLKNRDHQLNAGEPDSEPRFTYYAEDHENLQHKLSILVNLGCIVAVASGDAPIYRMTEEFVKHVLEFV